MSRAVHTSTTLRYAQCERPSEIPFVLSVVPEPVEGTESKDAHFVWPVGRDTHPAERNGGKGLPLYGLWRIPDAQWERVRG